MVLFVEDDSDAVVMMVVVISYKSAWSSDDRLFFLLFFLSLIRSSVHVLSHCSVYCFCFRNVSGNIGKPSLPQFDPVFIPPKIIAVIS